MYESVHKEKNCEFYGFANGDIMFDNGIVESVKSTLDQMKSTQEIMIIGGRRNFRFENSTTILAMEGMHDLKKIPTSIWAEDYFLIKQNRFPWKSVPKVVVGRPGYDNFIVSHALANNVSVVDATSTILAIHLVGTDGLNSGFKHKHGSVNFRLIGMKYDYGQGTIDKSQYMTRRISSTNITIIKRQQISHGHVEVLT